MSNFDNLNKHNEDEYKYKPTPEMTASVFDEVISYLEGGAGVSDLTTSELFNIRRDIENILNKNYELF